MENIRLTVQQPWLEWIRVGQKTTEGRPGLPGTRDYMLQKIVDLYDPRRPSDVVQVMVDEVVHYPNLAEYLKKEGTRVATPQLSTEEIAQLYAVIRSDNNTLVFSPEQIMLRGGINALHIRLVED